MINEFKELFQLVGIRYICFILVSQLMIKGIQYNLCVNFALPLLKSLLHVDVDHFQQLELIVMIPATIKPLFGLLPDLGKTIFFLRFGDFFSKSFSSGNFAILARSGSRLWLYFRNVIGGWYFLEKCHADHHRSGWSSISNFVV